MRIACFYHSLVSDWNHGNAHFLRGVVSELGARGHQVTVFEPEDGWSLQNLLRDQGEDALAGFHAHYPGLSSQRYRLSDLDLDAALKLDCGAGLGAAPLALAGAWDMSRLWFWFLGGAAFTLVGFQLMTCWILARTLEKLAVRENDLQKDLGMKPLKQAKSPADRVAVGAASA